MDAVNALLIRALLQYYLFDGDTFKIECPTGTGNLMNLLEAAREISNRLTRIFVRDQSGRRPVYGGTEKFHTDPHWELTSRSTNTSTATTAPASAQATRPVGLESSPR
jgi:hypothetical protein